MGERTIMSFSSKSSFRKGVEGRGVLGPVECEASPSVCEVVSINF